MSNEVSTPSTWGSEPAVRGGDAPASRHDLQKSQEETHYRFRKTPCSTLAATPVGGTELFHLRQAGEPA
jgi:hypothetical protein